MASEISWYIANFLKFHKEESKHKIKELSLFKSSAFSYGTWMCVELEKMDYKYLNLLLY